MRYDGQIAVVTGASSGIGRRMALDLAARGASVYGVARRKELLDGLDGVEARPGDVADTDGFADLLHTIERDRGRVDVLINNAGIDEPVSALDGDLEPYRRLMAVNYWGAVAGTLAVLPGMVERRHGVIVNVSSDSIRAPIAGIPGYAASKGAVSAFTESVSHEVYPHGVRVHVLYPGWVPTAMGMSGIDRGMPKPPKLSRRTEEQVSRMVLDRMGSDAIELNAVKTAVVAAFGRAFFPKAYRKAIGKVGLPAEEVRR
jgi:NAD(P)-dependent dehydrogenase (short-subunit alcohol dehydrogenase family)